MCVIILKVIPGHFFISLKRQSADESPADDIADEKLAQAKECGADTVVNVLKTDVASCEKAPSTIVISGALAAYDNAVSLTENHGTIVTVGLPPGPWPAPSECLSFPLSISQVSAGSKYLPGADRSVWMDKSLQHQSNFSMLWT